MKNEANWQPSLFNIENDRLVINRKLIGPSSWLPSALIVDTFNKIMPKYCRGNLLDLGCGRVPYYGFYRRFVDEVTCADWGNSPHETSYLDLVQDLNQPLDFGNAEFDTVLLSEVLEHVAETETVLAEVQRILKPEGRVIISVPFMYWLHEIPYDNYRFTCYGLKHKVEKSGLEVEELIVHGSWGAVLVDLISKRLIRTPLIGGALVKAIQFLSIRYFCKRNLPPMTHDLTNQFPLGYVCVARKVSTT